MRDSNASELLDAQRWGLPAAAGDNLAERLRRVWSRFRDCFTTKTRHTSEYAWIYLRGVLTMDTDRNVANIARRVIDLDDDGQTLQQFMSDSPWSGAAVCAQIQREIRQRPALQGGLLTLDDSGEERAGDQSAGAARQSLGRLGKVELGQVGVALGYDTEGLWAMGDAALYRPEVWCDDAHAAVRRRGHIPAERPCATKQALGLAMMRRAKANGLPWEAVSCDSWYGRDGQVRADLDAEGVIYMADIPVDMQVSLEPPVVGVPATPPGKRGRPRSRPRVLSATMPVDVRALGARPEMPWQPVAIRHTERGRLTYACTARRVWTRTPAKVVRDAWLCIRREPDSTVSSALSNARPDTPLAQLARWRGERYFAERIFQDSKSEGGWDELVARKYRAWVHHTALDALALWFVAETKVDWAQAHPRDPTLRQQLEVEVLPALSMANVRALLQAVLPLQQLSPNQATRLVITHLVHRARSTCSRLKAQHRNRGPT